ncbi:ArsR family transcriptional regulator [Nocardia sp. 852002-20019_SCH5090214]|uniref:HTH-type transcriptional repressor CzrA n=2 Tax=Nocardia TaxID=1817 RepID=A0A231GUR4_9NOCA|nr:MULTISPECIES: metalloregulator ArsR/SmtB family transcription factor [Nocardia]MDN2495643.1 metalloregulator ArsR/SmtB family transcription factor [Nocardia nova]OBA49591.1 ArsR family transcriptional regulator [Nocardia sp. 852002-20019_SCH5090214]OXR40322.1 HTH-type transcriptional repressor CzrA [Nocardia cerradoensis]PPJ01480.1 ArsR family transcriptional regulator [Nocardia nova]PPJ03259.1 ArsR family transcriptional regulator [Nocardia nova]
MSEPTGRKAALFDEIARVGKALGNGRRLQILDLLAQGERTVEAIAHATGQNVTTASANLQSLKSGGLVEARREGTRQIYRLAGTDVARLFALVQTVAEAHLADVAVAAAAVLGSPEDAITREELLRRHDAGEITLIDVRPHEEYDAGHIPGAISVPLAELAARLAELPTDRDIVAYCRGTYCVMAPDAVRIAQSSGRQVKRLDEGMLEWALAGLPVDRRWSRARSVTE